MFETVIIPLDGSKLAEAAIEPALEIAGKFDSTLVFVRAIDPVTHLIATQAPGVFESPASAEANVELIEQVVHAERDEAMKYLEDVRGRIRGKTEFVVLEGQAGDAITEAAKEKNASLVVMSSHGRGGLGRVIFGSVADHVLQNSHVPVLLIRLREEHAK
jgi:nucleotide-binding universal stress UspA family protein